MPGRSPLVGRDAALGRALGALTSGSRGVVLAGPAGIGRTALLTDCARRAEASGFVLAEGWPAPSIPPGALLVVDDLHRLDADTARQLANAIERGDLRLLGTLRTGVPAPPDITRAWRDHVWERVDVEPLSRSDIGELASHVAGVPVDGISVERLMTWTAGLPADLVAVLTSPVPGGWFDVRGPVATLRAGFPLAAANALRAGSPMNRAPQATRAVGELVAIGRHIPDTVLMSLADTDAVVDAEARGIVRAVGEGSELAWEPASALEGELTRAVVSDEDARRIRGSLATGYAAAGERGPDPLLVRAEACVERGITDDDVALLVDAADAALERRDVDAVIRLAGAAWDSRKSLESALLLGSVYELVGDHAARIEVGSEALERATDDRGRVIAAEQVAVGLGALDRHADATAVVERVRPDVSDPMWVGRLDALLANILLHEAKLDAAVALADPYLQVPLAASDAALMVAVARSVGGRTREALHAAEIGTSALDAVADEHRTATPSLLPITAGIAYTEAGDLDDADQAIGPVYDAGIARGDSTAQAWAALSLGRVALVRGAVRSAARWFREALAGYGEQRHTGYLAWAYSGLAGAAALAGDLDEAQHAARTWEDIGSHPVRLYEPDSRRLIACVALVEGDLERA
ncbi:MAG TPA: ATP-binding protein, partial [Acidimicrobiia bacterium]